MSSELGKIIADFQTQLATEIAIGGTSATLSSATDDDSVALPSGRYFFTIDNGNSQKEHISCDLVSTALTNIKTTSRQGVETAGVLRKHRVGASVTITDFAHIKKMNDLLDGTTDFDADTPLGYDGTVTPTGANEFSPKSYVDSVVGGNANYDQNTITGIAGETLIQGEAVYLKTADGKWWKTDASASATSQNVVVGIAQGAGAADGIIAGGVLVGGIDKTQTYTAGSKYYLSDTAGNLATSAGTVEVFVGEGDANNNLIWQHISNLETLTAKEKDALVGTSGTPSSLNEYVTQNDTTNGATITGTTIAFVNATSTITDSGNGFVTAQFEVGQTITVSGTASNDGDYTLTAVAAGTLTVSEAVVDESAGSSFTIIAKVAGKIARKDSAGQVVVPETPTDDTHAGSKKYIDDEITANVLDIDTVTNSVLTETTWHTYQIPFLTAGSIGVGHDIAGWGQSGSITPSGTAYKLGAGGNWEGSFASGAVLYTSLPGTGSEPRWRYQDGKQFAIKMPLMNNSNGAGKYSGMGFVTSAGDIDLIETAINSKVAFVMNNTTLFAVTADGSANTNTDVSSGITMTEHNVLGIHFESTSSVKFYINGTLVATHTTNIPTSGTPLLALGNNSGDPMSLRPFIVSVEN